jgi:hypothetical protein
VTVFTVAEELSLNTHVTHSAGTRCKPQKTLSLVTKPVSQEVLAARQGQGMYQLGEKDGSAGVSLQPVPAFLGE